jgi:hypothetical protein
MAKSKKRSLYTVVLEAEKGATHPSDPSRPLVRIMQVSAESEAGAREYAVEAALAESEAYGRPMYHVKSIEKA